MTTSTAGGLDRVGVEAVVAGISQYVSDSNRYDDATRRMGAETQKLGPSFKSSAVEAVKFGAAVAGVQLGVQAAAGTFHDLVIGSAQASIGFESSFTKIRQAANLTEAEFATLAQQNRDLAKTWPVNVEQINLLTARGAELGVRGVDGLNKFATTMIKAQLATGVAAIDLAGGLEQLRQTFDGQEPDIARYASVLVKLQSNFGAAAPTVLAFAQDISGIGKAAGLTVDQVLAISAAAVSVGQDSSFAFSTLLTKMNAAANGDVDALSLVSQASGKTAAQFVKDWKTDAAGALADFITGVGQLSDPISLLDKLGLSGPRVAQGIQSLAAQGDKLPAIFAAANKELAANEALDTDAARAAATHAAQMAILKNNLDDLRIAAGDAALQGVGPLVDKINAWLQDNGSRAAEGFGNAIETFVLPPLVQLLKLLADIWNSPVWHMLEQAKPAAPAADFHRGPNGQWVGPNGEPAPGAWPSDQGVAGPYNNGPMPPPATPRSTTIDYTTQAERDAATKAAEAAEQKRIAAVDKMLADAKAAREQADRDAIDNINAVGAAIEAALKKQADTQLQITTDGIDARRKAEDASDAATVKSIGDTLDAQLRAINVSKQAYDDAHTARLRQIDDEHAAAVKAIEDERDQTVKGLQDQIDAIEQLGKTDQRAALERQLALTYDATDRAKIQDQITALNRQDEIDALRVKIDAAKTGAAADARKRALEDEQTAAQRSFDAQAQAARDSASAQSDAEKDRHDKAVASLADELDAAKRFHDAITSDAFLQAKTRNMLASGEATAIKDLLESQGEMYRAAGQSLGESFRHGLEQGGGAPIERALGGIPGTPQNTQAGVDAAAELAFQQSAYAGAKAGGASQGILDLIAGTIISEGGAPPMANGLRAGEVQRTMLALLHPHEVVVNRSQAGLMAAAQGSGPVFNEGAFARMFDGATFAGTPEDNMRAARQMWHEMLDEQLGRDAFLAGAGR